MRLTRSSLVRLVIPGLVLGALVGVSGCKPSGEGSGGGASGSNGGDTIALGSYGSMSGDNSAFGTECQMGIDLAVKEINAKGGLLGKQITLDKEDDRSTTDEARTVATKFASDDKVVAVIGEVSSGKSLAAGPVLEKAGIPMVSPASTNPNVTKVGPHIFRVCYIDPFQGYVMAKFAHDNLKLNNVAIMRDPGNDYSVGLADVFKDEFTKMGGTITKDVSYSGKDSDFRSQLTQLKDAQAIFIPGYYSEIGTIARQARELGINVPLMGGDGWDSSKLVEGAGGPGKALEGCYFATHYSKYQKTPAVEQFVKAFQAEYHQDPPSCNTALGYDAVYVIAEAIKKAGSADRQKVTDALAQTKDYPGVTGTITMDSERNATKPAVVLQISGNDFKPVASIDPPGTAAASPAPAKSASRSKTHGTHRHPQV